MITAKNIDSTDMWSLGFWRPELPSHDMPWDERWEALNDGLIDHINNYIDDSCFDLVPDRLARGAGLAATRHQHKVWQEKYISQMYRGITKWHFDNDGTCKTLKEFRKTNNPANEWWLILWADRHPTEFAKTKKPDTIYQGKPFEVIMFHNAKWYHRMPYMSLEDSEQRWTARMYLEVDV